MGSGATNKSLLPALIEEAYEVAEAAPKTEGDSSTDDPRRRAIPVRRLNLFFSHCLRAIDQVFEPILSRPGFCSM